MDRIILSLNKIVEYNEVYFDINYYVLSHKSFRNNLLMFKGDINHQKTYMRLEQKVSSFLLNDPIAKRCIRYNGKEMVTGDIEIVEILKYSFGADGNSINDKFLKRPIPYAIVTNRNSMDRLLKNYLNNTDKASFNIYANLMLIGWEEGMYFEMYRD